MVNGLGLLVPKIVTLLIMINSKLYAVFGFFVCICLISCKQHSETDQGVETSIKINTQKIDKLPYFNTPDFAPSWESNTDKLEGFHKIPEFNFKNQLGNEITNNTLKGSIYVANFFFTSCPNVCLQLTNNMHELQEIYADDDTIKLLSHTVMPSVDTIEVLKEYGEIHNIDPKKWYLVTGEKEKIYDLAREAYFADDLYKQTNDKNRFVHTENLMLVDKKGHIRGVYKGTQPDEIKRINRHIEILKKE